VGLLAPAGLGVEAFAGAVPMIKAEGESRALRRGREG
jgi:hypothetical protein